MKSKNQRKVNQAKYKINKYSTVLYKYYEYKRQVHEVVEELRSKRLSSFCFLPDQIERLCDLTRAVEKEDRLLHNNFSEETQRLGV